MPLWHAGGQEFESPWLHLILSKWDSPGSAKPSAKKHWFRRFALFHVLGAPVRTPGLDPAGANAALFLPVKPGQKPCITAKTLIHQFAAGFAITLIPLW